MVPKVSLVWLFESAVLEYNLKDRIEANMPDSLERKFVHEVPWRNRFTSAGWKGGGFEESQLVLSNDKEGRDEVRRLVPCSWLISQCTSPQGLGSISRIHRERESERCVFRPYHIVTTGRTLWV